MSKKQHWIESDASITAARRELLISNPERARVTEENLIAAGYTPYDLHNYVSAFNLPTAFLESSRQIFLFDKDAAKMIGNTKGLPDIRDVLENAPYKTFAVDLGDDTGFYFTMGPTTPDATINNIYGYSEIDKSEIVEGRETRFTTSDGRMMAFDWTPINRYDIGVYELAQAYKDAGKSAHEFMANEGIIETAFIENIVSYICCKNAEIKTVYKPGEEKPAKRRRASKATWHQVGYRIGAELRAYERTLTERKPHQGGTVRPHMRRAHWHHFWTGPMDGERKLVLKWVPPTMVALKNGDIDGATGHRVPVSGDGE